MMDQPDRNFSILNFIRAAIGHESNRATDSELLGKFVANNDNDAFELLVWRHSGNVLRACRAVLRDHHAAEDAAQATFLALARQASSFKHRESIVGWLYCTARRISIRSARRRPAAIITVRDLSGVADVDTPQDTDEASPIHQELARLPERYRLPILLCCFEGLTQAEAARRLGWPLSTVGTRLARGKDQLQNRLTRRGVIVPAAGIAVILTVNPVGAVSAGFISNTAEAAGDFAAGRSFIRGVSEAAVGMARTELRELLVGKALWAAAIAACLSTVIGGSVYFSGFRSAEPPKPIVRTPETPITSLTEVAPQPKGRLDQATIEKYEALGAEFGRMSVQRDRRDLELILNEYDEAGTPCFEWRSIPKTGLPQLPQIDVPFGIKVKSVKLRASDIARFGKLKHLTDLSLIFTGIKDDDLEGIAETTNLKSLVLFGNRITDAGAERLSSLQNLEQLDLSYTHVGDRGIHTLTQLKKLRGLWMLHTDVSDEGMKELTKITGLEQLYLMQTDITDMGLKHLEGLKNLRALHLGRTAITDEGLRRLAPLRNLTYLDLGGTSVTDRGMSILAESNDNLETINLYETKVGDFGLRNLAPLSKLNGLCLTGCPITGQGVLELTRHRDLNLLYLDRTRVTDRDLAKLNSFDKLQTLGLQYLDVSDSGLESLTELKNLKAIDLMGAKVTGIGLQPSRFPNLRMVELSQSPVNEEGLRVLGTLDSMMELHLLNCPEVTDQGILRLVGAKNLRRLQVAGTQVTRAAAQRLNRLRGEGNFIIIRGTYWTEPPNQ